MELADCIGGVLDDDCGNNGLIFVEISFLETQSDLKPFRGITPKQFLRKAFHCQVTDTDDSDEVTESNPHTDSLITDSLITAAPYGTGVTMR